MNRLASSATLIAIASTIVGSAQREFMNPDRTMLKAGYPLLNRAPWICIIPGLFIVVLVLGLNLMGDGLRDAFDVRINAD